MCGGKIALKNACARKKNSPYRIHSNNIVDHRILFIVSLWLNVLFSATKNHTLHCPRPQRHHHLTANRDPLCSSGKFKPLQYSCLQCKNVYIFTTATHFHIIVDESCFFLRSAPQSSSSFVMQASSSLSRETHFKFCS